MQQSKKTLDPEIAKSIADKAEKALAAQQDLEWWSALLECFYGSGPSKAERKSIRYGFRTGKNTYS